MRGPHLPPRRRGSGRQRFPAGSHGVGRRRASGSGPARGRCCGAPAPPAGRCRPAGPALPAALRCAPAPRQPRARPGLALGGQDPFPASSFPPPRPPRFLLAWEARLPHSRNDAGEPRNRPKTGWRGGEGVGVAAGLTGHPEQERAAPCRAPGAAGAVALAPAPEQVKGARGNRLEIWGPRDLLARWQCQVDPDNIIVLSLRV